MPAPSHDMIVIKDLVKQFGPLRAVDGVSLSVPHGQVTVIIGPSGSGKSTVLRCINHLETPTGGEIWVDGKRLTHNSQDINAVRAEVGFARNACNEIIFMDRGKIIEQGQPAQFFASPREERTRQFLSQILH